MTDLAAELKAVAIDAKAWPFAEARDLTKRLDGMGHQGEVLFETGYGPSGLPHIGTFGEVVRTSMVRHAFEVMTGRQTRLVCFSDDMDGLRKVPDNVPNGEEMKADLGLPLTAVRDPFGTHPSFGEHNNARLQAFLDSFGFDYEFVSSTDCYRSGRFDDGLRAVLANYDAVMDIMLPTLARSAAQPTAPSSRSARTAARCFRRKSSRPTPNETPSATFTRKQAPRSRHPSSAGPANCSGKPTGRCAGSFSASITRRPERI